MAAYEQRERDIELYLSFDKNKRPSKKPDHLKLPIKPDVPEWPTIVSIPEMSESELQSAEYELLGLYVSSHPMSKFADAGLLRRFHTIDDAKNMPHQVPVSLAAVITNVSEITVAKSKQKMAFLKLEDLTGSIEAVCFSKIYAKYKHLIITGQPLRFEGRVQTTEANEDKITKIQLTGIELLSFQEGVKDKPQRLDVCVKLSKADRLATLIQKYSGQTCVVDIILEATDGTKFKLPSAKIDNRPAFTRELTRLMNAQN